MIYDLIIIGAGSAGLSAAIYAGRSLLKTLIIEKSGYGGRVNDTASVINYPGFSNISGRDIVKEFRNHASAYDTNKFTYGTVEGIEKEGDIFCLKTKRDKKYYGKAIIIATGTFSRILNIPGEMEYTGHGVSYCSTCDADNFINKDIHILGSGDLALDEADYLSNFCNSINLLVIHDKGVLDGNAQAQAKLKNNPKISFTWNCELLGIYGDTKVKQIEYQNLKTGEKNLVASDGIFIFAGMSPNSSFLEGLVELDDQKFVKTNEFMQTSVKGLFAAGDVRKKVLRQIVTAANDGAIATVYAERYIRNRSKLWEFFQGLQFYIIRKKPITA